MRVIKAYTDAASTGKQNFGLLGNRVPSRAGQSGAVASKPGGDRISLSDEAIEMLETGSPDALSFCPQDATYDQYGNVTREMESLQSDLRRLAAKFMASADGVGMTGRVNAINSEIAALKAQV